MAETKKAGVHIDSEFQMRRENMCNDYAFNREWAIQDNPISQYRTLAENWKESQRSLKHLREKLSEAVLHPAVYAVGAAGSLGRMEVSDLSDADLIVVLSDDYTDEAEREEAYSSIWQALPDVQRPKQSGVFGSPCSLRELCGELLGDSNESLGNLGKRMLLLLETQPVFGDENFRVVLDETLKKYANFYVREDATKEWTFLLNDLIRYFRYLCVNYQWDFEHDPWKWRLRNIKLRHSRLIMYAGLMFLLGEASKEREDKIEWMRPKLRLTPLERIAYCYQQNSDWSFKRIAGLYDVFLYRISERSDRNDLLSRDGEVRPNADSYEARYTEPVYAHLKANSDGLVAELLRFVFSRRGSWSERFFEYLIF